MSSVTETSSGIGASSGQPMRKGRAWPWMLGFLLLVATPVIGLSYRPEMSRWKFAQAIEAWDRGESERAKHYLQEALEWDPTNQAVGLLRIQQLTHQKNYVDALALLEEVQGSGISTPFNLRMELLVKAGRAKDAVEMITPLVDAARKAESETQFDLLRDSYRRMLATYLNTQAYMRGVGNLELDVAVRQIEEALDYVPASSLSETGQQSRAAMLDTRGFLRWRVGQYDEALADLEIAVQQAEEELKRSLASEQGVGRNSLTASDYRYELSHLKKPVAVMVYHRALTFQSRGEVDKAERDFARVRELGFEPGEDLF